ncbi:hypothetical protein pb186bvf_020613 [Paramecium bursaria]
MLNFISVASSMNTKDTLQIDGWLGKIVCKNYEILNKIDQGSFGSVYCAIHQKKNELYAVKIEQNTKQRQKNGETLRLESEILQIINGQIGFPRLYYYMEDATNRVLVETLLGSNLEQLFQKQGKRFSLNTVLKFLDQAITRLEILHQVGFIHRDIKPENFVINEEIIYLIDFGLCMRIYENNQHVKQLRGQPLVGTARFTPICSHQGYTQNRASDLESLGYLAIYFLNGTLPWMNVLGNTKEERFFFIGKKKQIVVGNRTLCNGLPREFQQYFDYIFGLQFQQQPNYEFLRKLLRKLQTDEQLEWMQARTVKTEKLRKISEHNSSDEVDKLLMKQSKESHKQLGRSSSVKEFQLNIQQNKIMQSRKSVQLDADLKLSDCDEYYPYQSMCSKLQQLQPLLVKFVTQK